MDDESQPSTDETEKRFTELLQELRVVQTGVQILAAFLLTLPFMNRWQQTTDTQRTIYAIALVAAACATALVIGPVSYHRTRFGQGDRSELLRTSTWLARGGLAALLVAAVMAVFLALDVAIGRATAFALTIPLTVVFLAVWYALPAINQRRR